ncbi:hypothetical protein [Novosphingobium terrae]|uniref:hypothetical protein n=1 Tax=Novosphingobium terrae TaxID=2726189 RepID=UPI00198186B5|nr:hypothetical protein [Novosphingobium terrae]
MLLIALALATASCPYPQDRTIAFASKAEMPQDALKAFGELAERNQPFNLSDVVEPGDPPMRRFVKAQAQGCDLLLTYEHGGRARGVSEARLRFTEGRWTVTRFY